VNYLEYIIQDIEEWLGILPAPSETMPVSSPGTSTATSPTDTTSSTTSTATSSDTTSPETSTNTLPAQSNILAYPQDITFGLETYAAYSQNPQNPIVATQVYFANVNENLGASSGGGYPYPIWVASAATDSSFTNIISTVGVPANHDVNGQQYYSHSLSNTYFSANALANALGLSGTTTTTAPIPIYVRITDTVNKATSNTVVIQLQYYGAGSFQVGWTGWAFSGGFGWY
jgi:hypothetical protein